MPEPRRPGRCASLPAAGVAVRRVLTRDSRSLWAGSRLRTSATLATGYHSRSTSPSSGLSVREGCADGGSVNSARAVPTEALAEAREGSVQTIVDLTTMDLGRNVRLVREVATRSGMQIIAATGAWCDIPRALYLRTPDEVAALFVREIREGIDGTDIKAGIIKMASDQEGVTPQAEVILRAAARAARQYPPQPASGRRQRGHRWAGMAICWPAAA